MKPLLRLLRQGHDRGGPAGPAGLHRLVWAGPMLVVPGGLNEDPAEVGVACLGDTAPPLLPHWRSRGARAPRSSGTGGAYRSAGSRRSPGGRLRRSGCRCPGGTGAGRPERPRGRGWPGRPPRGPRPSSAPGGSWPPGSTRPGCAGRRGPAAEGPGPRPTTPGSLSARQESAAPGGGETSGAAARPEGHRSHRSPGGGRVPGHPLLAAWGRG